MRKMILFLHIYKCTVWKAIRDLLTKIFRVKMVMFQCLKFQLKYETKILNLWLSLMKLIGEIIF